jgi:hypothetical protein
VHWLREQYLQPGAASTIGAKPEHIIQHNFETIFSSYFLGSRHS